MRRGGIFLRSRDFFTQPGFFWGYSGYFGGIFFAQVGHFFISTGKDISPRIKKRYHHAQSVRATAKKKSQCWIFAGVGQKNKMSHLNKKCQCREKKTSRWICEGLACWCFLPWKKIPISVPRYRDKNKKRLGRKKNQKKKINRPSQFFFCFPLYIFFLKEKEDTTVL